MNDENYTCFNLFQLILIDSAQRAIRNPSGKTRNVRQVSPTINLDRWNGRSSIDIYSVQ